jgi:uncharacterized protein YjdB
MKTKSIIFGCMLAIALCITGCGEDTVDLTGITVSETSISLPYGDTYQIVVKTVPDNADSQTFTYSSNNESVATVTATGVVTITGVGNATITITNGSFSKTLAVTGTLKSVNITPASIPNLSYIGETFQLAATTDPAIDATIAWTSSEPGILTITQAGLLEAKGEGTSVITASVGGLSKSVSVTVGVSAVERNKKGSWLFDDPSDLLKAAIGLPLEIGTRASGTVTAANGPTASNKAAFVTKDAWFRCIHGIAANGGTKVVNGEEVPCENVNEFSVMFDILLPNANDYHAVIQHNLDNTGEAGMYFKSNGRVGQGTIGQTENGTTVSNKWYRFVFSVRVNHENNRVVWDYYWNGEPLKLDNNHEAITVDNGRFTLSPDGVVFFGDGEPGVNGADASYDDNDLFIAEIAIWDYPLSAEEVATLGMFEVDGEE